MFCDYSTEPTHRHTRKRRETATSVEMNPDRSLYIITPSLVQCRGVRARNRRKNNIKKKKKTKHRCTCTFHRRVGNAGKKQKQRRFEWFMCDTRADATAYPRCYVGDRPRKIGAVALAGVFCRRPSSRLTAGAGARSCYACGANVSMRGIEL